MADSKAKFPDVDVSEETVKDFLNELRDSGSVNMFGAGTHLEAAFDMSRNEARAALVWWMEQF
jgi:hypothetical protein